MCCYGKWTLMRKLIGLNFSWDCADRKARFACEGAAAMSHEWDTLSPWACLYLPLAVTDVIALHDTCASLSLLKSDVARRVIWSQGQSFTLVKFTLALVTLRGDQLNIKGSIEIGIHWSSYICSHMQHGPWGYSGIGSNDEAWVVPQQKQPCNAVGVKVVCN